MTVYVDAMRRTHRTTKWPYTRSAHMLADSVEELHRFAAEIGLKREWFQPGSTPHYDLTDTRHARALSHGAVLISRTDLVALIQRLRNEQVEVVRRMRCEERLSFTEIGKRLEITGEGARQICVRNGIDTEAVFSELTGEVRARIIGLVEAGALHTEIVEGVSQVCRVPKRHVEQVLRGHAALRLANDKKRAAELYAIHKSTYVVGEIMQRSYATIWNWLSPLGVLTSRNKPHDETDRQAALVLLEKHSIAEVSRMTSISKSVLSRWRRSITHGDQTKNVGRLRKKFRRLKAKRRQEARCALASTIADLRGHA
jgi:hypothetical protein